jgi:hypothetical protein
MRYDRSSMYYVGVRTRNIQYLDTGFNKLGHCYKDRVEEPQVHPYIVHAYARRPTEMFGLFDCPCRRLDIVIFIE